MCLDCGCEQANESAHKRKGKFIYTSLQCAPTQSVPTQGTLRRISLEHAVLTKNDSIAEQNRNWFQENNIKVINLISSPGSGKTLLLEKTIEKLNKTYKIAILVGDQEKDFDTQRLMAKGAKVKQLNTLSSCHLDASQIANELNDFVNPDLDLLIIENVGNLVCPAAFDLGESAKVALLSTPEGEDKPSKYPLLFNEAEIILVTKIDLKPHLDWDQNLCEDHIRKVNSKAPIVYLSSKTGEGMDQWIQWITNKI